MIKIFKTLLDYYHTHTPLEQIDKTDKSQNHTHQICISLELHTSRYIVTAQSTTQ